ncbi:MAG: mRNA-degrading endonuclease [Desulfovibrio sp.]|nr:mRNA-degrading endonuclease [Desulfovibrio sp.]
MPRPYIPEHGDLVWLSFDPQAGHEQAGRRPALVLSPASYNRASGLMLACPLTTRVKGYPFDVPLPEGLAVSGVIQSDQVRSLDWGQRRAERIAKAPAAVLAQVLERVGLLLGA